ncbi:MAG: ABC transporter permease [Ignavibacteriae bacterium]|nr:MAG: ABC transporter permease [Ignavibacteriota bacterium]
MKQIYRLFKSSYRIFWNDKVSVALTFIVPLVLMSIFGAVFGGSGSGPQGIRLAVLNQSNAPVAKRIESSLDTLKTFRIIKSFQTDSGKTVMFDTLSIQDYVRSGKAAAALVLPPDTYADTSVGLYVKFYYDPKNDMEMQTVKGFIQQVVFSQFPSVIVQSSLRQAERYLGMKNGSAFNRTMASLVHKYFDVDTNILLHPTLSDFSDGSKDSSGRETNILNQIVQIESQQLIGKEMKNPWATRSVGGWGIMFLMFTLTATSSSLFDERKSGILMRMLTSPVSRTQILWNKYLFNLSLGIIQLLFMFTFGWIMFQVDIFSNFLNLMLIILASSVACTALGMLIASFSQTRQQANGLGTLLILSMSAIGGAWFPTSFMPSTIQFFSKLTFVYWSIDGFMEVLWRGVGFASIIPHLAVLFGIGTILNIVSVRRFRKGQLFD